LAANGCRAVAGLTKFRQIKWHDPGRLNLRGIAQSGPFIAIRKDCVRQLPTLNARQSPMLKEMLMKKTLAALAAAATVATAIAATPTPADARCWGGCAVGVGIAGFVAGAIVGNAVANAAPAPAYVAGPAPGYVVYPAYAAPLPGPRCYWTRQPVYDMYGNVVGWRGRPIAVCPY
jgi:hypothetical protein